MASGLTLHVEIVTTTGVVYTRDAYEVVAPGGDGQLGILPRHAPLMTTLTMGALHIKHDGTEDTLYIGGGFMEVLDNRVVILADEAERATDIDEAQAEQARQRAQNALTAAASDVDRAALEGQIQRALGRIHVSEIHRTRRSRHGELPSQG